MFLPRKTHVLRVTLFRAKSVTPSVSVTLFELIERKVTLLEKKSVTLRNAKNAGKTAFLRARVTLVTLMTLF